MAFMFFVRFYRVRDMSAAPQFCRGTDVAVAKGGEGSEASWHNSYSAIAQPNTLGQVLPTFLLT